MGDAFGSCSTRPPFQRNKKRFAERVSLLVSGLLRHVIWHGARVYQLNGTNFWPYRFSKKVVLHCVTINYRRISLLAVGYKLFAR